MPKFKFGENEYGDTEDYGGLAEDFGLDEELEEGLNRQEVHRGKKPKPAQTRQAVFRSFTGRSKSFKESVRPSKEARLLSRLEKLSYVFKLEEPFEGDEETRQHDLQMTADKPNWYVYWAERFVVDNKSQDREILRIADIILSTNRFASQQDHDLFTQYVEDILIKLQFYNEKREVMNRLYDHLEEVETGQDYAEEELSSRRHFSYDEETKQFFTYGRGGIKEYITEGDIVADYDWGIKYTPDIEMPRNVWRHIRKQVDINEARREIQEIVNNHLVYFGGVYDSSSHKSVEFLKENLRTDHRLIGVVAEKIVFGFLNRVSVNYPELSFNVEPSSVIEDSELKYDFKITVRKKDRGIATESEEVSRSEYISLKKTIGIQLTISKKEEITQGKADSVESAKSLATFIEKSGFIKNPVDDIVLVKLSAKVGSCFSQWLGKGRPTGGPEKFLSSADKNRIITEIFKGLLDIDPEKMSQITR